MAIFLIRHGETESNAARIVQTPEVPLSERGLAQAEALGRRLEMEGVATIASSDLCRAVMTAECIRRFTGAAIVQWPELQERNFGDIRGTSYAEIGFNPDDPNYEPPGGERWQAFHDRVATVWPRVVELAGRTDGNLAVVTHGLVCHSLALHHLTMPDEVTGPLRWGNASLTVVEPRAPWKVSLLNCTTHLEG